MRITTIALALAFSATSALAGGLSPEIVEADVMEKDAMAAAAPSINPTYIVVGVLAALLIASAVASDSDEAEEEVVPDPEPMRTRATVP